MKDIDIFDSEIVKVEPICVGLIWFGDESHCVKIEQNPDGTFVNSEDDLRNWANGLNNAWSETSSYYGIHPNFNFPGEWIAEKTTIVYDGIEAHIAGNGNSPQEALAEVDRFAQEIIEKYADKDDEEDE